MASEAAFEPAKNGFAAGAAGSEVLKKRKNAQKTLPLRRKGEPDRTLDYPEGGYARKTRVSASVWY